jgi:hypothetical protein
MLCSDQVKIQKFVKKCYFITRLLRIDFYKASVTTKFFQSGNDQFHVLKIFLLVTPFFPRKLVYKLFLQGLIKEFCRKERAFLP